jgi:hypothetical protein
MNTNDPRDEKERTREVCKKIALEEFNISKLVKLLQPDNVTLEYDIPNDRWEGRHFVTSPEILSQFGRRAARLLGHSKADLDDEVWEEIVSEYAFGIEEELSSLVQEKMPNFWVYTERDGYGGGVFIHVAFDNEQEVLRAGYKLPEPEKNAIAG